MNYIVTIGERQIEITPFEAAVRLLDREINDAAWSMVLADLQPGDSMVMHKNGRMLGLQPKGEEQKSLPAHDSP